MPFWMKSFGKICFVINNTASYWPFTKEWPARLTIEVNERTQFLMRGTGMSGTLPTLSSLALLMTFICIQKAGFCGQKQVLHRTVHRSGPDSLISGWKNSMLLFPENTTTPQCYTSPSQTHHITANFVPV